MTAMSVPPPAVGGRYQDRGVLVARRRPVRLLGEETPIGRTPHFALGRHDGQLVVVHDLDPGELHNGITDILVAELFTPGWLAGAESFERVFTGLVVTMHADPLAAWELFYRNSLRRLAAQPATADTISEFSWIYRHAEHLIAAIGATSVLDVGSCFGFFPLRLAGGSAGALHDVIACDVLPEAVLLLEQMARRLGRPVRTLTCDAARVPLPDGCVDAVTVLHLLEHVDEAHGARLLDEAVRIAKRSVVVAVPLEDQPEATYGHIRTVNLDDLQAATRRWPGWTGAVSESHGGWLVLDRTERHG